MAFTFLRMFSQKVSGYWALGSRVPMPTMAMSEGLGVWGVGELGSWGVEVWQTSLCNWAMVYTCLCMVAICPIMYIPS